ncbi:hypothetical protein FSOLCH5_014783 [Fusarium solani]
MLEDGVGLVLEEEDRLRLEFVQCESEPDGFDPTVGQEDEDEDEDGDEDEDEDDWDEDYWFNDC